MSEVMSWQNTSQRDLFRNGHSRVCSKGSTRVKHSVCTAEHTTGLTTHKRQHCNRFGNQKNPTVNELWLWVCGDIVVFVFDWELSQNPSVTFGMHEWVSGTIWLYQQLTTCTLTTCKIYLLNYKKPERNIQHKTVLVFNNTTLLHETLGKGECEIRLT